MNMSTSRIHHPLPAPVVHAGFSIPQSKSHVLAGVQDAYWSDDEAEDAECPLCLEEMDISDLNFKPCICGYQICRFCWHHIKENLNKRCPACRRIYTDEAVEFKPVATQDHKRLTQQKKQRERERKDLEALGRKHLTNVRIVQRNVAYVIGIGPRFAKEELIPTLRSHEYFGQYGKISKIFLLKRTPPGASTPVVGLYITYHRKEDAARAISAVDGTPSPGGGREVMRASYGTAKYCMAFLRGHSCNDHSCTNIHEWGDEKDCFTKEDLTTLKHTMKATETRRATIVSASKNEDSESGLPRSAAWGQKSQSISASNVSAVSGSRGTLRRGAVPRQPRPATSTSIAEIRSLPKAITERRSTTKAPSQASSSRPSTPSNTNLPPKPVTSNESKAVNQRTDITPPQPNSPTLSGAAASDPGSCAPETTTSSPAPRPSSVESVPSSVISTPSVPPGLPALPPGLVASSQPRSIRAQTTSPQTPLLASGSVYQMSNAARALLDDVKARRENTLTSNLGVSPFPDFDRTLQTLSASDGSFSFNLDPKLTVDQSEDIEAYAPTDTEPNHPFGGPFTESSPGLRLSGSSGPTFASPPGLTYTHNPNRGLYDPISMRSPPTRLSNNYIGSFNPFGDAGDDSGNTPAQVGGTLDDDPSRKISRFVFARGRQGSSAASSYHVSSPLSGPSGDGSSFGASEQTSLGTPRWGPPYDVNQSRTTSSTSSPHPVHVQAQGFTNANTRPSFDGAISEAQLRDFIQNSRERATNIISSINHTNNAAPFKTTGQPFHDPAIMSASFNSSTPDATHMSGLAYGPPPGLASNNLTQRAVPPINGTAPANDVNASAVAPFSHSPIPVLSDSDFPALSETVQRHDDRAQEVKIKVIKKSLTAGKTVDRQKASAEKLTSKSSRAVTNFVGEKHAVGSLSTDAHPIFEEKEKVIKPVEAERTELQSFLPARTETKSKKVDSLKASSKSTRKESKVVPTVPIPKLIRTTSMQKSVMVPPPEPVEHEAILSRKLKKNKPALKQTRSYIKEDGYFQQHHNEQPVTPIHTVDGALTFLPATPIHSDSYALDQRSPVTLAKLFGEISAAHPELNVPQHPIFDLHKINPTAKVPLEYGPLVHALSALSVGGTSFANHVPSGSIDNAVASFQQLLETLTQTISDLLRLLPRTTWDDSSSFDGVLKDMLKGDDFLDDGGDEGHAREDEVAALTLALERRARWMEVQLSKLEELHRDINTAAVRAVLAFNDGGWDKHHFFPRLGNTLVQFDKIGMVDEITGLRPMTIDELDRRLTIAKDAAKSVELEMRSSMEKMQTMKPQFYRS